MSKIIFFDKKSSKKGILVPIENSKQIPFNIKRVFYIYDIEKESQRGDHGHQNLEEIIISIQGSCKILVHDAENEKEFNLDSPEKGLYLSNLFWLKMRDFSNNCILLVLCSDFFNEEDNIDDFSKFLKLKLNSV